VQADNWWIWFLDLMPGLLVSAELTGMLLLIGLPLGMLLAIGLASRNRAARFAVTAVVELSRTWSSTLSSPRRSRSA
jgi:polar amino acid transport system permease protein